MVLTDKLQAGTKQVQSKSRKVYECKYIRKEVDVFEATGERSHNLEKLFQALISVPPTSFEVEVERALSAACLFITRLRTRLTVRSIDYLHFLKLFREQLLVGV